jgi:hypothetical protein
MTLRSLGTNVGPNGSGRITRHSETAPAARNREFWTKDGVTGNWRATWPGRSQLADLSVPRLIPGGKPATDIRG